MLLPHTLLQTVRRHIVMSSDGFCLKICLAVLAVGHWTAPPGQLRARLRQLGLIEQQVLTMPGLLHLHHVGFQCVVTEVGVVLIMGV